MCKSANQPGGPYRCSGDARAAMNRAEQARLAARGVQGETVQRQALAEARLESARGLLNQSDEGDPNRELLEGLVDRYVTERDEAAAQADAAHQALADARARHGAAARDYDATPAGIAELQGRIDDLDSDAAPTPVVLSLRSGLVKDRDDALAQMNDEARQRREKWGSITGERVPISRLSDMPNSEDRNTYARFAAQDGVRASAINHGYMLDGDTGQEYDDYEVTFYRTDGEGQERTMRVAFRNPTTSEPPTQADVLTRMSRRGMDYETSRTPTPDGTGRADFRRYCTTNKVPDDERDAARQEYDEGKRYARQLRTFFEPETAGRYFGQAARESGRFLPMDRTHGRDGRPLFEAVR